MVKTVRRHAPCPEIVAYALQARVQGKLVNLPIAPKWIAKWVDGGTLLSPTFEGATKAEAVGAARSFWVAEQIAIDRARVARGETPRQVAAA